MRPIKTGSILAMKLPKINSSPNKLDTLGPGYFKSQLSIFFPVKYCNEPSKIKIKKIIKRL